MFILDTMVPQPTMSYVHAGRTKTLQETYPQYAIDWTLNAGAAAREMLQTVDRVISGHNPWSWMSNSCHIDTWLMVELSFFGCLASSTDTLFTDSRVQSSPALTKLFKVLTAGGKPNQDQLKMGYWAMEIEEYVGGTRNSRNTFKQVSTYQTHSELLHSQTRHETNLDMASTYVGMAPICTNPDHIDQRGIRKRVQQVTAEDTWYSMPDDWTRTKDDMGRWSTNQCHQIHHSDLADVLETLLGRADGETTNCKVCAEKYPGTEFQEFRERLPQFSLLPLSMEFNVDPGSTIVAEPTMDIGGLKYTLLAVVFGNGVHFKCNILLRQWWYHYDDMGIDVETPNNSQVPSPPRLVRMTTQTTPMTPPPPVAGFKRISYRYIRENTTTVDPIEMTNWQCIGTGVQFNSMWRLLVDGYNN